MTGRWYRLAVRAVRRGWISYKDWRGTPRDHLRERLLFDDMEHERMEALAAMAPGLRGPALAVLLPWLDDQPRIDLDPDALYEEVMGDS